MRSLDRSGFPSVQFSGEYPIGHVDYVDAQYPVVIRLEAFSPFIPLDAPNSALPCTLMRFTVKNASERPLDITLAGWLANAVLKDSAGALGSSVARISTVVRDERATWLAHQAEPTLSRPARQNRMFADFENGYGAWRASGDAFGKEPAHGTLPGQNEVSGFVGKGLVNTYLGGDERTGKLTSPAFTIEHRYVRF
ncbi:MAG: GH116 family glycosyl-hydrolase [Planctomycetota bacterium]